jgi:CheY-like chemotaxis protein
MADAARLQQVLWNLLSNAIKFTPPGGSVRVLAVARDGRVEISVSDDGCGIEPEFLPHVFERFRQADASAARAHMGLGLGLAITRHLVELHGGQVRAESAGRDKGATFIVSLPLSQAGKSTRSALPAVRAEARPRRPRRWAELEGLHVLVLEDDRDARELLAELLASNGARVSTAANVREALAAMASSRPDLIVSDIGLPEEDGHSFIRRVRALPPEQGGDTPAIALTAYARAEDRAKALGGGFDMHLAKPVDTNELLADLATLRQMYAKS